MHPTRGSLLFTLHSVHCSPSFVPSVVPLATPTTVLANHFLGQSKDLFFSGGASDAGALSSNKTRRTPSDPRGHDSHFKSDLESTTWNCCASKLLSSPPNKSCGYRAGTISQVLSLISGNLCDSVTVIDTPVQTTKEPPRGYTHPDWQLRAVSMSTNRLLL
ncbi:hypothetical protein EDB84DRAFT_1004047 [Lactarius hengduanensis]|nr:hypothetical protein EDB84DRAFT_1004047 [Lactarius hengduanensis]